MKKYSTYIVILTIGLFIGWLVFGGSSTNEVSHEHNNTEQVNQLWTCSMHPQIMQPEPGACPICGMDLIPAEASTEGLAADQFKLSPNAMALANIQTSIIGTGYSEETQLKLSGKIVENGDATATQPAHFNGRIEQLFVNSIGEKVTRGQVLATVYSPELVAAQQELLTTYKLKESKPKLYDAVKSKFKNWQVHDSELSEIIASGKVKTVVTIYSHITGTVSEINLNVGSHIMDGQPIFKVTNLNTVWANFDVYENQIDLFKIGQHILVTTNAYPSKEFEAIISFIDPVLNSSTRTVNMRVVLKNNDGIFKPGMFVEGVIAQKSSTQNATIAIPASAVLWTGKRSIVYIKVDKDNSVFELREITLGNKFGDSYKVTNGLKSGEEIVTNGTFTIDAAAQLNGKKSMMNKAGGKTMTGHEGHGGMNTKNSDDTSKAERIKVSSKFQEQLKSVFDSYISLKDALVQDDAESAKSQASSLLQIIEKVDMKLLPNAKSHELWMPLEKEISTMTTSISKTTNIEQQRQHFMMLSDNITRVVQIFGINQKVYQQLCTMANNNKGAYWLSLELEIRNPYFGDMMLNCGSVEQEIE